MDISNIDGYKICSNFDRTGHGVLVKMGAICIKLFGSKNDIFIISGVVLFLK